MALVWQLHPSAVDPCERLVLLNLANHAHADGRNAWPAVRTISNETSLSTRAVQKILGRLLHKRLIIKEGVMARGAVRYALDLSTLDRERRSQSDHAAQVADREPRSRSDTVNREPGSQSAFELRVRGDEPGSGGDEPCSPVGVNDVHRGGEPRSPDPSLIRQIEPSENKNLGADAPNGSSTNDHRPEDIERICETYQRLAVGVRNGHDLNVIDHAAEVSRLAAAEGLPHNPGMVHIAVARSRQGWTRRRGA